MSRAATLLAALAVGARALYPQLLNRRQARRRPIGADGIIFGAGPIDLPRRGGPGALLIHGAGDTPQVMAGLAAFLHDLGFAVSVPLLSAHGRSLSSLSTASASQWRADVNQAFASMRTAHDQVCVVGLSVGGALALQLAADRADMCALVLLAPYVAMPSVLQALAATSRWWGWLLPYFSSRGGHSIRDPRAAAQSLGHGLLTPAMLRALREVVIATAAALPRVTAPTLVIQSREDNRIPTERAEHAFNILGSREKRFELVERAAHVITVDYGHEHVFALTARWLQDHMAATQGS